PARTSSLWLATSASAGSSRSVRTKDEDRRIMEEAFHTGRDGAGPPGLARPHRTGRGGAPGRGRRPTGGGVSVPWRDAPGRTAGPGLPGPPDQRGGLRSAAGDLAPFAAARGRDDRRPRHGRRGRRRSPRRLAAVPARDGPAHGDPPVVRDRRL